MAARITFRPTALDDLRRLYRYIRDQNRDPTLAIGYVRRIRRECEGLIDFPERGTTRDDLLPGLRTFGFERRVTIAFRVMPKEVEILRVLYGGRDLRADLLES